MSVYAPELSAAEGQGRAAYEAMEAWVGRPLDAPDIPGEILEGYARALHESRERLQALVRSHGSCDDIAAALDRNEDYHRSLGLTLRDQPAPELDCAESAEE